MPCSFATSKPWLQTILEVTGILEVLALIGIDCYIIFGFIRILETELVDLFHPP